MMQNKKIAGLLGLVIVGAMSLVAQANVLYVDGLRGSDVWSGTSSTTPKKTIQSAVNAAVSGDEIRVVPGTYAPINVTKPLTLVGTGGACRTAIDGSGKYRCAKFSGVDGYVLRGFTLQNGYAGKDHGGGAYNGRLENCVIRNCRTFDGNHEWGGGGLYQSHLYDCIVENCRAGFGGAMHLGQAWRCTFRNNYAWDCGGALWQATVHHSLIHDNRCDGWRGQHGGAGAWGSYLYNCTVTRNAFGRNFPGAGGLHGCWSYNCIVWDNRNPHHPDYHNYRNHQVRENDHWQSDPHFCRPGHPTHPDFHLRHDSPCRRIAVPSHFPEWGHADFNRWHGFDHDRNPRFHGQKLDLGCYEEEETFNTTTENADGSFTINYNPMGEDFVSVTLDGGKISQLSSATNGVFVWQPQTLGWHTNVITYGMTSVTNVVKAKKFAYWVQDEANPPMAPDEGVVLKSNKKTVASGGAIGSIATTGSTSGWVAETSVGWIRLSTGEGKAGKACGFTVSANTNAETRIGYIYVSGHTYTVEQTGVGSTLDKASAEFETEGGTGTIDLTINERHAWEARPNVDWISVSPTHGISSGKITYTVAPLYDITTRRGTITVGGNTFTVFQYGRRMGLEPNVVTNDYYTHVYPVTVNALDITAWDATPNNSWLSIVSITRNNADGLGGGVAAIAMGENPSYVTRYGSVTIGTETLNVIQGGRTDLLFEVSPLEATASANGANGKLAVLATPDLPWTVATSNAWLTVYTGTTTGSGNGNISYTASPNTTVYERKGTVTVTPDPASGLSPVDHQVTQPAATVAIDKSGYEFAAPGESTTVTVTVAPNVAWLIEGVELVPWLRIDGSASHTGPQTITLAAEANPTVNRREATIRIAGKAFKVAQKGRGVRVEYTSVTYGPGDDGDVLMVYPDGDVEWDVVSSTEGTDDDWLTYDAYEDQSGVNGVLYYVAAYTGDGTSRTATLTIGDQVVYITQTAYKLTIDPCATNVAGNARSGEFGFSATIEGVWDAIATEPWITVTQVTSSPGGKSGKVMYTIADNDTGKTRTGTILVNGEEYAVTQAARQLVPVTATVNGHGGTVANAGNYDLGATVSLEAVPDGGYAFSYWTLPDMTRTMNNPIEVLADSPHEYAATFKPLTPEITSCVSSTNGVTLAWQNLAWAVEYTIYRGSANVPSEALAIETIANDGSATYLDATGDIGQAYFYWIKAIGAEDETMSAEAMAGTHQKPIITSKIFYTNLKGATHPNPATYVEESTLAFSPPTSGVTGYTFNRWEPASISSATKGPVTVEAVWTANHSSITYNANGGSGVMPSTAAYYDEDVLLAANGFVWAGHTFLGWATEKNGEVVYQPGNAVRNLTAAQNGVVTLYAVWQADVPELPEISPADGSTFKTENCLVTITCETPDVSIYYTTNGRSPRVDPKYLYAGPFTITNTTTVLAFAVNGDVEGDLAEATITRIIPEPLTLKGVLDEPKLGAVTTGGDANWSPVEDPTAQNETSAKSGAIGEEQTTWLETTVTGAGTLTFKWKTDCEHDDRKPFTYDHATCYTNGAMATRLDGKSDWEQVTLVFADDGEHTIRWEYSTDDYTASGYQDCLWVDAVTWSGTAAPAETEPTVPGDPDAQVSGDATNGFVIKPSADKTSVEVTIPIGVDPSKVTVEIGADVTTVKPNGAKVKILKGLHNITDFLDMPSADASGSIDLTKASVKEAIVKEAMDTSKGAVIELNAASPTLTTPATRPGLTYEFYEGTTLETVGADHRAARPTATKLGDGTPWTPTVTVKGGTSGFYSIGVTK